MQRLTAITIASILVASLTIGARAAGPAGHWLLGKSIVESVLSGQATISPDLKAALETPEGRRAFYGGTVGPDICEARSHYGDTADLARRLLSAASADLESARRRRDATDLARAQREIAFAYGWLAHCGTDLNVHPKINALVGDTFRDTTSAEQKVHGVWETQLTAYLQRTMQHTGDQFDVSVPYDFVSRVSGVDDASLRQGLSIVKAKTMAELTFAGKVKLSDAELARAWRETVRASRADSIGFMRAPASMGNWDLDCGKISTRDFDDLRRDAIEANGGKLPPGWGRSYLAWWNAVRGMSTAARRARLRELITGRAAAPSRAEPSSGGGGVMADAYGVENVPTLLRRTRQARITIPFAGEMVRPDGLKTYWGTLEAPSGLTFPFPGLAQMIWTYPHGSWRVSGDDTTVKTDLDIQVDMEPDGSAIRRLTAQYRRTIGVLQTELRLAMRDIPLNRRVVGTLYEGDVQYAVWDAAQARQCVTSAELREVDASSGAVRASGTRIEWGSGDTRKPAILIRFRK